MLVAEVPLCELEGLVVELAGVGLASQPPQQSARVDQRADQVPRAGSALSEGLDRAGVQNLGFLVVAVRVEGTGEDGRSQRNVRV